MSVTGEVTQLYFSGRVSGFRRAGAGHPGRPTLQPRGARCAYCHLSPSSGVKPRADYLWLLIQSSVWSLAALRISSRLTADCVNNTTRGPWVRQLVPGGQTSISARQRMGASSLGVTAISHSRCSLMYRTMHSPTSGRSNARNDRLGLVQTPEFGAKSLVILGQMLDLLVQHAEKLTALIEPARPSSPKL